MIINVIRNYSIQNPGGINTSYPYFKSNKALYCLLLNGT